MALNAIIVEDEANSREILNNYLVKYCPEVNLVGEAASIDQAKQLVVKNTVDLVFLDVEMPFGTGFDFLDQLPERTFETVFVTAYNQYAIDALNNHAAYYLMKPINIDELIKAVNIVTEIKEKENQLQHQILAPKTNSATGKITIPQQDGFEVLDINDIVFCKADDNYTEIHLANSKKLVSKTLKYFQEALAEYTFARIHKSYLVNVNKITKYKKGKGGSVIVSSGKEILVSASQKANLLSYFK